jgi:tetratricopeptide (TPR) repeat protein
VKYQAALASIDWKRLYHDCQGYWFFEDTKKQWEEAFQPDYVLIDSRTGHTDVEGICTRQLADAVVVLFFPNEQNLAGLRDVCGRIRGERTSGLEKDIRLHFVMSNVPDLDDEDKVLRRRVEAFRKGLGIERLDVIHRYESAALFNQAVFVLDRPRSRLAREYRRLKWCLVAENPADRDGALRFLDRWPETRLSPGQEVKASDLEPADPLNRIAENFLDDPEVLIKLAECREREKEIKKACAVLDRVLKIQPDSAQAVSKRAEYRIRLGDTLGAAEDLVRLLQLPGLEGHSVVAALGQLQAIAPNRVDEAAVLPAVQQLPPPWKGEVAKMLAEWKFEDAKKLAKREENLPQAIQLARESFNLEGVELDALWPAVLTMIPSPSRYRRPVIDYREAELWQTRLGCLFKWLIWAGRTEEALEMIECFPPAFKFPFVELATRDSDSPEAIQLLREYVTAEGVGPEAWVSLFYCLMRARRWEEAIETLAANGITAESDDGLFFLAMAQWGRTGILPEDLCRRALNALKPGELAWEEDRVIARSLMHWALGNRNEAFGILMDHVDTRQEYELLFSFWSFRYCGGAQYREDCRELHRMIQGEPIRPAFLGDHPAPTPG